MTLQHDMTRVQTLKSLGETFRSAGIDTAQRDARLLLLNAAGISHLDLIQSPRETLGHEVAEKLSDQIARRLRREPVARILGEWEFWSLPFTLSPATLIPRPDSETVVAAALIALKERRHASDGLRILDLGTGTGCLLIALLHELPGATGIGVDLHDEAVQTAWLNAKRNAVDQRAEFIVSNWGEKLNTRFDLIISNPPYIPDRVINGLEPEVREHDPRFALSGGTDGLDAYRAIAAQLPDLLKPGGIVGLEIGSDQSETVSNLYQHAGYEIDGPFADFGARPRALILRKEQPKIYPLRE
ncbi:MAG: peptide chain release factor N(5)-glutamine methyltransferase [Hyphomicrobiales bacterium]